MSGKAIIMSVFTASKLNDATEWKLMILDFFMEADVEWLLQCYTIRCHSRSMMWCGYWSITISL